MGAIQLCPSTKTHVGSKHLPTALRIEPFKSFQEGRSVLQVPGLHGKHGGARMEGMYHDISRFPKQTRGYRAVKRSMGWIRHEAQRSKLPFSSPEYNARFPTVSFCYSTIAIAEEVTIVVL